jgi:hypothetical protein
METPDYIKALQERASSTLKNRLQASGVATPLAWSLFLRVEDALSCRAFI